MGNVIMTGVYANISEDTRDTNKYHGLLITVTITASTMMINTWQNFGQRYRQL